jgi:hypothetical protein
MKKQPTTVRLPKSGSEALLTLETRYPGTSRSKILEKVLIEAVNEPDRIVISNDEFKQSAYIHRYLWSIVKEFTTEPKRTDNGAAEKALAARVTAKMIKRVFLEAKGRIELATHD